jgi:hypothetical protein
VATRTPAIVTLDAENFMQAISSLPTSAVAENAAKLTVLSAVTFLVLLGLLHVLKPEFAPSWHMISEYEIGRFGWVMRMAFLCLSLGYASLFVSLRSQLQTVSGKVGLAILLLGAIGSAMGGIFTTDPINTAQDQMTTHGNLHGLGALLGIPTLPLAATLISLALARNHAWSSARPALFGATALTWLGLVGFAVAMAVMLPRGHGKFSSAVEIGWPNRFLIVSYAVWLITVAWQALALRNSLAHGSR